MKKLFLFLTTLGLIFMLSACHKEEPINDDENNSNNDDQNQVEYVTDNINCTFYGINGEAHPFHYKPSDADKITHPKYSIWSCDDNIVGINADYQVTIEKKDYDSLRLISLSDYSVFYMDEPMSPKQLTLYTLSSDSAYLKFDTAGVVDIELDAQSMAEIQQGYIQRLIVVLGENSSLHAFNALADTIVITTNEDAEAEVHTNNGYVKLYLYGGKVYIKGTPAQLDTAGQGQVIFVN